MSYNAVSNEFEGYIYCITNKVNNKVYIGQTSRTVEERYRQHILSSVSCYDNYHIHNSISKHGVDNFEVTELMSLSNKDVKELAKLLNHYERYFIDMHDSYNNGYNMTMGGDCTSINDKKSVCQYDLYGELVDIYDSMQLASSVTGVDQPHISKCCNHTLNSAGGFYWFFTDDDIDISKNTWSTPVVQYDLNGNVLKKYTSIKSACNETGLNKASIINCCKGTQCRAGSFIWRYKDDSFDKFNSNPKNTSKKIVYQFDDDFAFVAEYDSANKAGKLSNTVSGQNIGQCCKGKTKKVAAFTGYMLMK